MAEAATELLTTADGRPLADSAMGLVFSAFALGYALAQIPSGWFADKAGPRIALAVVVTAWSALTALTGRPAAAADPLTAALFGNATSIQAFSRSLYFGAAQIGLRGRFKTSTVSFTASQLPSPGNGVFLTSKQTIIRGVYSYTGIRKASLSLAVNRMSLDSLGQAQLGTFSYTSGGVMASYKLLRSLEAVAQYDARDRQINQAMGFARLSYRFSYGVNWNPGEFPINFW